MGTLGRRAFLLLAALLSPMGLRRGVAVAQRAAPSAPVTLNEFLALSARLTGRTALDRNVGAVYLKGFTTNVANIPLLRDLSRRTPAASALTSAHDALAASIVAAWYTGVYEVNGERRLATHTGALMWDVLGRPAPGVCAGATGAWSQPPRRLVS